MNICCIIIDNKILGLFFYFLGQSEELLTAFGIFMRGLVLLCKTRLWFGPNSLGGVKFRSIVQVNFFNDDWCTGEVIKQKNHFLWSCGLVPLCLRSHHTHLYAHVMKKFKFKKLVRHLRSFFIKCGDL